MPKIRNLKYDNTIVEQPIFNGVKLTKWIHNGVVVWENGEEPYKFKRIFPFSGTYTTTYGKILRVADYIDDAMSARFWNDAHTTYTLYRMGTKVYTMNGGKGFVVAERDPNRSAVMIALWLSNNGLDWVRYAGGTAENFMDIPNGFISDYNAKYIVDLDTLKYELSYVDASECVRYYDSLTKTATCKRNYHNRTGFHSLGSVTYNVSWTESGSVVRLNANVVCRFNYLTEKLCMSIWDTYGDVGDTWIVGSHDLPYSIVDAPDSKYSIVPMTMYSRDSRSWIIKFVILKNQELNFNEFWEQLITTPVSLRAAFLSGYINTNRATVADTTPIENSEVYWLDDCIFFYKLISNRMHWYVMSYNPSAVDIGYVFGEPVELTTLKWQMVGYTYTINFDNLRTLAEVGKPQCMMQH